MRKMKLTLLLSLFLMSVLSVQAQQGQALPPLVSVNGTGEVRVQPNEVIVNLGVETRGKTLDEARKETDKKTAAVINYLKKQGVDAKHIQTSYVTLQPIYSSGEYGRTTPDFYLAQKNMTILVKKLDKFDELLSGIYGVGVNHVNGVNFQVSTPEIEKYKAEARKKAVANAKAKATQLTSELGAKVGRVYAISESSNGGVPRPMYKMAMVENAAYDAASGPTIAGGEVVITSNVDVSFVIE